MKKSDSKFNKQQKASLPCKNEGSCSRCLSIHRLNDTLPDCCFKNGSHKAFEIWIDTHLTETIQEDLWSN